MHYLTFNKEADQKWYVDLPDWTGSKSDLEMVMGADNMLDIFAQGEDTVDLSICETLFYGCTHELVFDRLESGGAWYNLISDQHKFEVWLCFVTKFVFGNFPERIYLK